MRQDHASSIEEEDFYIGNLVVVNDFKGSGYWK